MPTAAIDRSAWEARRRRAGELRATWPFAADVLDFYTALLPVQQRAYSDAVADAPAAGEVPRYIARHVLPRVIEASAQRAPARLMSSAMTRFGHSGAQQLVDRWLRGGVMAPDERFLARAASTPVLEALGPAAGEVCAGPRDAHHCPRCGGAPLLSIFSESGESHVTARRLLECARCSHQWPVARMVCPFCAEAESERLPIYREAEDPKFPHLRIDGCSSCNHYLVTVDLTKDGRAVPVVDEMAAIPLGLYAKALGYIRAVPNLMEF